jgi:mannosyltransferase
MTVPPSQTFTEQALWACRSTRSFAILLVIIAIIIGARLRFHHLARFEMNGDEAASWAAASAPSAQQVGQIERQLDPGKLALYDVTLHGWIAVFGDSLVAMRAMSAALGTIAIVLVFVAVREVCRSLADEPDGPAAAAVGELAGAFAALLYATNLEMVLSDRTVRMYPLVMCAELLQITFFVRAQRRGGMLNYAGIAIFTAAMVACNFTSTFLIVAEALWLGWLLLAARWDAQSRRLAVFRPGCAVAAGIAILGPWLSDAFASSRGAVEVGAIDWIKLQPVSWPYTTLRASTGSHTLFWIFVALAIFGIWQRWRSARLVVEFFALWTTGPMLAVMALTYLVHPLESQRYVLIAFVGMVAFAAFGAASVRSTVLRIALAALLIHLSLRPVHARVERFDEAAWREATLVAVQRTPRGSKVAVFPSWCINVVRFYMPHDRRDDVTTAGWPCGAAPVLVMSGFNISPAATVAKIEACYPRTLAELPFVQVRSR